MTYFDAIVEGVAAMRQQDVTTEFRQKLHERVSVMCVFFGATMEQIEGAMPDDEAVQAGHYLQALRNKDKTALSISDCYSFLGMQIIHHSTLYN